jgi:Fe2+ or Zn2+ uptake regulation protein
MCEKCNCVMNFDSKNICKKILKEAKKLGFEVKNHNI